jgi:hypothetical protein
MAGAADFVQKAVHTLETGKMAVWVPDLSPHISILNGIYLTPVSGTENKMGDVVKGEHREWARFILHNVNLKNFPLRWVAPGYRR